MPAESSYRLIPELPRLPIVGNLLDFRSKQLDFLLRVNQECGEIGSFRLGRRTYLMLNTPQLAYAVLVQHARDFEKPPSIRILGRPFLGNGLLTSDNAFNKQQRKLIAPAFQHQRLVSYAQNMVSYSQQLQSEWVEGQKIDIVSEMMHLTLRIIGKILFDADLRGEAKDLGEVLTTAIHQFTPSVTSLIHIPYRWPTPRNYRIHKSVNRLKETIYRVIDKRRRLGEDKGDLLSVLLRAKDEDESFMNDDQILHEALTLFLAGHETTAIALAWAWYLLTQHPDAYFKMREEIDNVLGRREPKVTDLENLPYTLQVLKEALRLYPPIAVFGRQPIHPIEIESFQIPSGAVVLISPYVLHRQNSYFPDPDRFDPDRFKPEAEKRLPRFAFIPFSGGPRFCIGHHLAMMEAHLVLATLAQHVVFELVEQQSIEPEPLITLRPKNEIKMIVRRREI